MAVTDLEKKGGTDDDLPFRNAELANELTILKGVVAKLQITILNMTIKDVSVVQQKVTDVTTEVELVTGSIMVANVIPLSLAGPCLFYRHVYFVACGRGLARTMCMTCVRAFFHNMFKFGLLVVFCVWQIVLAW